jgi:hypothetical protein
LRQARIDVLRYYNRDLKDMMREPWHFVEALILEIRTYEARAAYPIMFAFAQWQNSQGGLREPEPIPGQKPSRPLADHERVHGEDYLTFVHTKIPTRGRVKPAFDFDPEALMGIVELQRLGLLSDDHWVSLADHWEAIVDTARASKFWSEPN